MSLASGVVLGGRRAGARLPATVVVPERGARTTPTAVRARYGTRRSSVMLRGIVWAGLLLAASAIGSSAVAVVMFPAALIASVSALRAMPEQRDRLGLAVSIGGPWAAAASFVIADSQSANLGLTLALLACVYDAASYLNGNGRGDGGRWGVGAGLASVAVLAIFVAAVLVPPFSGAAPWLVVGVTGLLAPLGVRTAARATAWHRLAALRRLDSMILAAPAWVLLVALFVHT